jgi:hypothetical protein
MRKLVKQQRNHAFSELYAKKIIFYPTRAATSGVVSGGNIGYLLGVAST